MTVDFDYKSQKLEERKNKIGKGGIYMQFDEAYHLKNRPTWLVELYHKIDRYCMGLKGATKSYRKTYIRYSINNKMFCNIHIQSKAIKIYLTLDFRKLKEHWDFMRDYSAIGRTQTTELWLVKKDLDNEMIVLDAVEELIKQAYKEVQSTESASRTFAKQIPKFVATQDFKLNLIVGTDGFVEIKIRVHKSQLSKTLDKIIQ